MSWFDIGLFIVYAAAVVLWLYWALPVIARWLVKPGPKPDPEDVMASAVYDLQVALGNAIRPPLENLVKWLSRPLPPPRKPDDSG